jgi:DNA-binding transcriptional MerR regulator
MPSARATFTVSELAKETGIPVARIKFYLREQLLPAGNLKAQKRAFYEVRHAQRLRLIHTLREVAELGVPAIRDLCKLLDGQAKNDLSSVVLHVIDALGRREPRKKSPAPRELARTKQELSALFQARGMRVRSSARALVDLANALVGLRQLLAAEVPAQALTPYLDAMCALAETDFAAIEHLVSDGPSAGLAATYGTVLWEPVLILLRRIAHESVASTRLSGAVRKRAPR